MKQIKNTQSFTIPIPRFAGHVPTWNLSSSAEEAYPQIYMVGQPENHISHLFFFFFLKKKKTPSSFLHWKTTSKTEVCSGSYFTSKRMRWNATFADDL